MKKKPDIGVDNGVAVIDGKAIEITNLRVERPVASGAHGSVFEGTEIALNRKVAVKIWYQTGQKVQDGAIGEARKLASLTHPLFVTVYQLDVAENAPYSTMEFLPGPSLKTWLRELKIRQLQGTGLSYEYLKVNQNNIRQRCAFWFLYSSGLGHIYSKDLLHGDPHLGNVIVFEDSIGTLKQFMRHHDLMARNFLSIKMLDLGTSLLRDDPTKMHVRESKVIFETAEKLFPDFNPRKLMCIDMPLAPNVLLAVLDKYAEYVMEIASVPGMMQVDFDFLEHGLPQLLGWCPFFNYEVINEQLVSLFGATTGAKLMSDTLWQMQNKHNDLPDEEFERIEREAYEAAPAEKIQKLTSLSGQLRNQNMAPEPEAE